MRAASAGYIALLAAGGPFLFADLYTLSLSGGTIYRWTSADRDLVFGGNTFLSAVDQGSIPILERGETQYERGLAVSTMDLTLYAGDTVQVLGINAVLAAHNGALDGASLRWERLAMPTWGDTSNGSVVLFEGNVAGVDVGCTELVLHIKSEIEKLRVKMPKVLFTPSCANTFCDANCGLSLATFTVTKSTTSGSTALVINGASGQADGYYQNGIVTYTSGVCAGARRAVTSYVSGVTTLAIPLPAVPGVGDTFTISPGCARTKAACAGFSNSNRFKGCPYVPVPESVR